MSMARLKSCFGGAASKQNIFILMGQRVSQSVSHNACSLQYGDHTSVTTSVLLAGRDSSSRSKAPYIRMCTVPLDPARDWSTRRTWHSMSQ